MRPDDSQNLLTTEDGAYEIAQGGIVGPRKSGAHVFVPSEDEWFKAAYFIPANQTYSTFPSTTPGPTNCEPPTVTPHRFNCDNASGMGLTPVASYAGTRSAYGTYDQGGNVMEWTEGIDPSDPSLRVVRGGAFDTSVTELMANSRTLLDPTTEAANLGFRIASSSPCH